MCTVKSNNNCGHGNYRWYLILLAINHVLQYCMPQFINQALDNYTISNWCGFIDGKVSYRA